ncbi:MAG: hypothetical protein ABUT39_28350 [Acidobacteriota bacterium]
MQPTQPHPRDAVRREVEGLLGRTASFQGLDAPTRQALTESMSRIAEYLAAPEAPLAGQMAPPDLQQRLSPGGTGGQPSSSYDPLAPSPAPGTPPGIAPAPAAGPAPAPASGPTARAGEVARATLNAIDFPGFVASLIQGTFQAIVDASIQQMEAYAELLKNVATTVDRFMDDNITDGAARDYLADQHPGLLARDTSGGMPRLSINQQSGGEMPSFFKDLGFASPQDLDDDALEQVVVPAARRQMAERRQQTLATMVLMGMNRVVVDDGEITAKLVFHIDASESSQMRFDQTKTTAGNMSGRAGSNPFGAQAIMVNTSSINAQSDLNVRADLTGQVRVKFRSETFPLERFADSMAIQLINSNAKVPPPAPPPAQAGPAAPAPAPPAPIPAAPAPAPKPAPPPAPVAQGLAGPAFDPWSPGA